jgi:phage terminase large subunit
LVTQSSRNLIKENRYYQWKQTTDGKFINQPKDWMNHLKDACRYAYSLGDFANSTESLIVGYDEL